jgi:hypothetical protein
MNIFLTIAERKIQEAIANGDFENLPGAGRPIDEDQDTWVPEDLRMAYRILKNAGCIPPELQLRKEIAAMKDPIRSLDDSPARTDKLRELNFRIMKLNMMRKRPLYLEELPEYEARFYEKVLASSGDD